MLVLSDEKLEKLRSRKYKVYSKEPLVEGSECFNSSKCFNSDEKFCITNVSAKNIKHNCNDNKFYYTVEDLSNVADWFPTSIISVSNNFVSCNKNKKLKYVTQIENNTGKSVISKKCIIDTSKLPAFCGINEDLSVYEYRFYLTLFNDYTVKQCQYERHNLQDATFTSSKYDLTYKLQNSNFLKSKDFKIINVKRSDEESVFIGLIISEPTNNFIDYGRVYINMENKISIIWH